MRREFYRRLLLSACLALLASTARATQFSTTLVSEGVTTAVAGTATNGVAPNWIPSAITLEAVFTYGSGGTSAKYWVQTSLDGGTTWVDIACFAFATSSASKVGNLTSVTAVTTLYTPTDGTLADNTVKDGIIGDRFRVKRTTTGTYAGGTTISITAVIH